MFDTMNATTTPKTPKEKPFKERIVDEFLKKRQVFLWGAVMDKSAEEIIEKILYLEYTDPGKPILLFINSPGGVITSGMAIYDIMQAISSPVYTITTGMAASMGAILFCAGEKGHRYILKHAKVMIHQPLISGQIVAPAIDIKIRAEEIKKTRLELNEILANATGKTLENIEKDTDRDFYMTSEEAVTYGIADKVITNFSELLEITPSTKKPATVKKASSPAKKTTK